MSANGAPPGGIFTWDLEAPAGDLAEVYRSFPTRPVPSPFPAGGEVWVNFAVFAVLLRTVVPPSETVQQSFPVPPDPIFLGLPLCLQAATLSPVDGIQFSTPVIVDLN